MNNVAQEREIRDIYSMLEHIAMQHEKFYEQNQVALLVNQNNQLVQVVNELKELILQVKNNADIEREKAAERHRIFEEECKIAKKRHADVIEALGGINRQLIDRTMCCARSNMKKQLQLALICIKTGREWYIIHRQRNRFNHAMKQILQKFPGSYKIKVWKDVAQAIDIGNGLKQRLCWLKWMAHENTLRVEQSLDITYTDNELVEEIDSILQANNPAIHLSKCVESIAN